MLEKQWVGIIGYEGYYEVSQSGEVRGLDRVIQHGSGGPTFVRGRILTPTYDKDGYRRVSLSKDGKAIKWRVNRLVANHFIPNPKNLPVVNHIDCNVTNDSVANLEWCTAQHNAQHAASHGLFRPAWRSSHKITVDQVREIRRLAAEGVKYKPIAARYGLHVETVGAIVRCKTWQWVLPPEFAECPA